MTDNADTPNLKHFLKCPFCPCVFLTREDLQRHLECMGDQKDEHLDYYRRTHGRIEHGAGNAE